MSRVRTIKRLISDAESRLRQAREEKSKIEQELETLRIRLRELELSAQQLELLPETGRTRGLSEKWAAVLNYMVLRSPNPVSVDEILQFGIDNDLNITRSAVRAQLYNYSQRGFVERVGDGLYLTTENARVYCNY